MNYVSMLGSAVARGVVAVATYGVIAGAMPVCASDHGAEVNPTGNPLGGGPGYTRIVERSSADYIVSTKAQLLSALSSAGTGDIIYVEDTAKIDLTGSINVGIAAGVTLASGRGRSGSEGGLIFTNQHTASVAPLLSPNGTGVRITGLRVFGPDFEVGDHDYDGAYCSNIGIRTYKTNLEVDNCELSGWVYAAVMVREGATGVKVHHNYIHHNRRNGVGYGVCVSNNNEESGNTQKAEALVEANVFNYNRHHIAGHGTKYESYEARYNLCLENEMNGYGHSFDMHGHGTDPIVAGSTITIHHNTFKAADAYAIFIRGVPDGKATINNNWFAQVSGDANPIYQITPAGTVFCNYAASNPAFVHMTQSNNVFQKASPNGVAYPVPVAKANVTSGRAPLTVNFSGSGSSGSIQTYVWKFGDGKSALGAMARGVTASYTFTDPGVYQVELEVWDSKGLPARTLIPITVYPAANRNYLSFWVKDSYRGTQTGYYQKQALINGAVVWQDDVAGDEEWQHVLVDLTDNAAVKNAVAANGSVTLAMRTSCTQQAGTVIEEILTFWDDAALFGFDVKTGNMETKANFASNWTRSVGTNWKGSQYSIWDARSGHSCALTYKYASGTQPAAGTYAQISQTIQAKSNAFPVLDSVDATAPAVVANVYDGTAADVDVISSSTTLSANWATSTDADSGIAEYWYCIGTTAGATNIVAWTNAGAATSMTRSGLSLTTSATYYVSVKAENGAGLQSAARSSDGVRVVRVDTTPPAVIGTINDGTAADVDVTSSSTTLSANWCASTDADSGIAAYWYCIGTAAGGTSILGWTSAGTVTSMTRSGLSLASSTTYYVSVKAENGAGVQSAVGSSDGIQVTAVSAVPAPVTSTAPDGCVGYWKFDEGAGTAAADTSDAHKDGTLYNGTTWSAGYANTALSFDGVNDYVKMVKNTALATIGNFTVDFWIKPAAWKTKEIIMTNGVFKIYHRGDWTGGKVYFLVKITAGTRAGGDSSWVGWTGVRSVRELKAGTWYHVTCVKSGKNMILYINGKKDREIAALSGYTIATAALSDLVVGGSGTYFNGCIDELSVWNKALATSCAASGIAEKEDAADDTSVPGFAAAAGGDIADADGNRITVPAGAVTENGRFVAVISCPDRTEPVIEAADATLPARLAVIAGQNLCREIQAQVDGVAVTQFAAPVTLTFSYPDADHDGTVDGTAISEERLVVAVLDEEHGTWTPLRTRHNAADNTVSVETDQARLFTILGVQGTGTVDDVQCYPNPCRLPQDGHVRIGAIPNEAGEATISIYTLTGDLVTTLKEGSGITVGATDKQGAWDGTNDDGSQVAGGLYLCLIKTEAGKKVEKIGLLR